MSKIKEGGGDININMGLKNVWVYVTYNGVHQWLYMKLIMMHINGIIDVVEIHI